MFPRENIDNGTYLIFASHVNVFNMIQMLNTCKIPFTMLQGCYKGQYEISYMVNKRYEEKIHTLGLVDKQECTMSLSSVQKDGLRGVTLTYYKDTNVMRYIGRFIEIPIHIAKDEENYTQDLITKKCYIAKIMEE